MRCEADAVGDHSHLAAVTSVPSCAPLAQAMVKKVQKTPQAAIDRLRSLLHQ